MPISFRHGCCLILLLAGCATQTPPAGIAAVTLLKEDTSDPAFGTRHQIVNAAEKLLGVPYVLGGNTPAGIDCSGLVQYTYRQAGISVPRTAAQLFSAGKRQDYVLPGDLLFFTTDPSWISHVGIYVGGNQMIHASSSNHQVSKVDLNQPYWRSRLAGGATFIAPNNLASNNR